MDHSDEKPKKACHNCRRQRLRCDRGYPYCSKCLLAGEQCLGYGQLFRWTGSVASRGRLAGQPSSQVLCAVSKQASSTTLCPRTRPDYILMGQDQPQPKTQIRMQSPPQYSGNLPVSLPTYRQQQSTLIRPSSISSPWVLTDPLFQDMTYSYRFYLSHCASLAPSPFPAMSFYDSDAKYFCAHVVANRLCQDLVSYDTANRNPFRGLLPLTRAHPLLQHIIVASSAAHMANITRAAVLPLSSTDHHVTLCREASPPSEVAAARQMTRDSLVAKHHALKLMSAALQDLDAFGGDVVFFAALFFVNVELIESGKDGWRAHLDGACRIMALLQAYPTSNQMLRDYMLSDCSV